ncbi:MAG: CDP-diacylglycerol--serine O-phosphatidyltransferase [Oligoflexia bacterium]|nr:CDP-diacylglycerol--serine O-phosphatidyltransferase [Oligoflexia bacterium]
MNQSRKFAFFLPNIFTALNMACGFASVVFSIQGRFFEGAMVLLLGAIFDSVDGRVARLTGTQSSFGEQFDSISDVVSFGVAPSVLMYQKYLTNFGRIGAVIAFIFLLCGALRLARFNANIDKISSDYFQGLPIPSAAAALIGYILLADKFPEIDNYPAIALVYTLFYGVLMITNIPFNSFKNSALVKKHKKAALFIVFVLSALVFSYFKIMIALGISVYVFGSLLYYLSKRREFGDAIQWSEEAE